METPQGAIYHVARDGQVIGAFSFPTLAAKFKDGSVKPTDHYLIDGTSDWKVISDLKPRFADYEQEQSAKAKRLKAEAKAAKEAEELEVAKARALEAEADQLRREQEAAERRKPKPWKCHTCETVFMESNKPQSYPNAAGLMQAIGCCFLSVIFCWVAFEAAGSIYSNYLFYGLVCLFFSFCSCVAVVAAIGYLIAFGVEVGLQHFHSYRPRCPNCSSPYCSKQPE